MSNLTELKRVVSALGGTPAASDTNDESIGKIADALENGGGGSGGVLVVHDNDGTLDKTWGEIYYAQFVVLMDEQHSQLIDRKTSSLSYTVTGTPDDAPSAVPRQYTNEFNMGVDETQIYTCETADEYPRMNQSH